MKQRIISAMIAITICLPIIYYGGTIFYLAVAIIGMLGFNEMLKLRDNKKKLPQLIKIISLVIFIMIMMDNWGNEIIDLKSKIAFMLFLLIMPIVFYNDKNKYNIDDAFYLMSSILFLGIGFNSLALARIGSLNYFIYLLLIVVITDTFAYFTGYFIGKNKLCPKISPNKTWEGFTGGLTFGTIAGVITYNALFTTSNIVILIIITIVLSVIGQLGDMVFSSIKRYYGIKDFGNIMPGHGGILDRLDSFLFVLIAFTYLSRFI